MNAGGFLGAAPEDLQALAAVLAGEAARLRDMTGRVAGQLAATTWSGPDVEAFGGSWGGQLAPALTGVAQLLDDAAARLRTQAQQQVVASGGAGGSGGGAGGSGGGPAVGGAVSGPALGQPAPGTSDGVSWRDTGLAASSAAAGVVKPLKSLAKGAQWLAENERGDGEYGKAWHKVMRVGDKLGVPSDWSMYEGNGTYQKIRDAVSNPGVQKQAKAVAKIADVVDAADNVAHGFSDLTDQRYADGIDHLSQALKDSKAGYVPGVLLGATDYTATQLNQLLTTNQHWEELPKFTAKDWENVAVGLPKYEAQTVFHIFGFEGLKKAGHAAGGLKAGLSGLLRH